MSVLLEAKEANEINDIVRNEISSNLFIFCNYEPTHSEITNDSGGLFLLKVSNFYKLIVDSGWVIKQFAYIYSGEEKKINYSSLPFAKQDIDKIRFTLNDLRTGFCHNVSRYNGDNIIIHNITEWVNQYKLKGSRDYSKCIKRIDDDAQTIIDGCKQFIDGVKNLPDADREAAIGRWKSVIIEHYKEKHDIFINLLGNYYLVKNAKLYPKDIYYFKRTVNEIILSYFTYDLKQYQQAIQEKIEILRVKDPKTIAFISKSIDEVKKQRAYGLFETEDYNSLYPKDDIGKKELIDLFFEKELEKVINDVLNNSNCSLLPQDIFNEVFDKTETTFEAFKTPFKRFDI